jgi:hypothetical protein
MNEKKLKIYLGRNPTHELVGLAYDLADHFARTPITRRTYARGIYLDQEGQITQWSSVEGSREYWDEISADVAIDLSPLTKKAKRVVLNDDYTAEVLEGSVKVGCQTFSFDAVEQLYEAVKEKRK